MVSGCLPARGVGIAVIDLFLVPLIVVEMSVAFFITLVPAGFAGFEASVDFIVVAC